jgi:hypothetical protein
MTDVTQQPLSDLDRFASHVLATGGAALSAFSVYEICASAKALLSGYATYGAAVPMVGYAGILLAASTLVRYHLHKLDTHPVTSSHVVLRDVAAIVPSIKVLELEKRRLQDEIKSLQAQVDELRSDLANIANSSETNAPAVSPKM